MFLERSPDVVLLERGLLSTRCLFALAFSPSVPLEWTADNHLRHTKFITLRDDKNVKDVVRE